MRADAKKGKVRESLLLRAGVVGSQLPAFRPPCFRSWGRHTFLRNRRSPRGFFPRPSPPGRIRKGRQTEFNHNAAE